MARGYRFARHLRGVPPGEAISAERGRLERYFDAHTTGPGIWKWRHYFDIYERHLSKFVGQEVHVVEVGIYSGGSLPMWREYLGSGSRIYGVDIEPACRTYADEGIEVFIGDQADDAFWARFREAVPHVDVVIDDGGHELHQQIATLECLLPHIRFGGVYICEDINHVLNPFHSYIDGLGRPLNRTRLGATALHQHVASVHRYPQVAVIEKPDQPIAAFDDPRRGTEWQPFW